MVSLLLLLASTPDEGVTRLRTILPNGAVILAEHMPKAKSVAVQLVANTRAAPETMACHGQRHLLEHLMLARREGRMTLDQEMEAKGVFFTGYTYRDATRLEALAQPQAWEQAVQAVGKVIAPLKPTPEQIAAECSLMEEEIALSPASFQLSVAAWATAYGQDGLDPQGTLDTMKAAKPDDLELLRSRVFEPSALVMCVSGPMGLEEATEAARKVLQDLPSEPAEPVHRPTGKPGRVELETCTGEARAAIVGPFQAAATLHTLAAGLAIASAVPGCFLTCTPSSENGLIIVGRSGSSSGLGLTMDAWEEGEVGALYSVGKRLALAWFDDRLASPRGSAELRALLMASHDPVKPEELREKIQSMTWPEFKKAFARFKKESCAAVVGTAR